MNKNNLIKTSKIIAICAIGGGMLATTGVIAHQLIISNDNSLKILKVENLGESEPNEWTNVCKTYLKITLNKNFGGGEIFTDISNENIWTTHEGMENSSSELFYVNGNKLEISIEGGYVPQSDDYGYELNGPIITKISLHNDVGWDGLIEVSWGFDLVYWGAHESIPDDISGEHVKDIHYTANPLK